MRGPGDAGQEAMSSGGQQEAMPAAAPWSNDPSASPRAAVPQRPFPAFEGYSGMSGHVQGGAAEHALRLQAAQQQQQQSASSAPATPTWHLEQPWARPAGPWPEQQGRQEQQHAGLPASSSNQAAAAADVLHSLFLQPGARQLMAALLSEQGAAASAPGHAASAPPGHHGPLASAPPTVPADHYSIRTQAQPEPSYSQTALGVPVLPGAHQLAASAMPATPFSQQAWIQQHQQQQQAAMALASQQWGQAWQGQQQFAAPGAAAVSAATLVCHPLMPADGLQAMQQGVQAMQCAQFVPVAGMFGLVGGLGMPAGYGAVGVHAWQHFGQQQQHGGGFQAGQPQQGAVVESVAPSEAAGLSPRSSVVLPGSCMQPPGPGRRASAASDESQVVSASAASTAASTAGSVATWLLSPVSAAVGWLLRPAAPGADDLQHSAASQLASTPVSSAAQAADSLVCACARAAGAVRLPAEAAVLVVAYALHQQLVASLYCLLAASAAAAASARIALSAARAAAQGSAGLAWFAAREARLFGRAAAAVAVADLQTLPQQLLHWQGPCMVPGDTALLAAGSSNPGQVSNSSVSNEAGMTGQVQQHSGPAGSAAAVVAACTTPAGRLGSGSSMMLAADSAAVLCGLYTGLGVKLWFLLAVWVPLQATRIWAAAWVQGWLVSLSGCRAAADVLLQLAWSLACCTVAAASSISSNVRAGLAAAAGGGGLVSAAVWLVAVGFKRVAAHAWQLAGAAAASVPGGLIVLQLLQIMAGWWCAAALAGMQLLASANDAERARSSLNVKSVGWQGLQLVLHLLQRAGEAACVVSRAWAVAGAEWFLLGASPVARAAVFGMAGMLQHLAVETAAAAWRLGVALYQAHQEGERGSSAAAGVVVATTA